MSAKPVHSDQSCLIVEQKLEQLESVFDSIYDPVVIIDSEGRVVKMNRAARAMYGMEEDGDIQLDWKTLPQVVEVLKHDGRPVPFEQWPISKLLRGEPIRDMELFVHSLRSGRRWVGVYNGSYIRDENGRITHTVIIIHDVTERKRVEQQLRESELRFRAAYEQAAIGIELLEISGKYMEGNDMLSAILGYSKDELKGMTFRQITPDDDFAREKPMLDKLLSGELSSYSIDKRYIRKDGQTVWVRITSSIVRAENPYRVSIIENITEQKQAQEGLEAKTRELEMIASQLEAKNKELETIIGIVSHDLRSPIVNIKGFAREIAKDIEQMQAALASVSLERESGRDVERSLRQSIPESLGFIETSAAAMGRLVESLVRVARAGLVVPRPEEIDMNGMIQEILANLIYKIKEKNVDVMLDPVPPCISDRTQTMQIFTNLIDNAVKYLDGSRPGTVRIWGKLSDSEAIYCIEDNGMGIPQDKQDKIFEIFYRVSRSMQQGEGIGLATVKRMVEKNNGRIWLESIPGEGSKFFIALPR